MYQKGEMAHYQTGFYSTSPSNVNHTYRLCRAENPRRSRRDSPALRRTGTGWRCKFRLRDTWTAHTGDTPPL